MVILVPLVGVPRGGLTAIGTIGLTDFLVHVCAEPVRIGVRFLVVLGKTGYVHVG